MLLIALYLAGLALLLREAVPWLRATSSGVIRTRGHKREAVTKAADPARYAALLQHRFRAMGPGALVLVIALVWTAWIMVNVFAQTL